MNIERIELSRGYTISRVLKGGWQLAGGHGKIDRSAAIGDMFKFVDAGITTFDFGDIYTGVEEMVGDFLTSYKAKFGEGRARDVQLHTKYVPDLKDLQSVDKEYTTAIVNRSIKRLGVDAIDLVQFHWWDFSVPRYVQVARDLDALRLEGKIRNIGVTNFDVRHLKELVDSNVPVVSNQLQYSVLDLRPEKGMVDYCRKNNIRLLCYGTLAGGFLSERYLGKAEPHEPLENRSLTKYKLIIDDFGGWGLFQELLSVLHEVAHRHGVSISNVASRYVLEKPQVAGIIIGARDAAHLEDNARLFSFKLTQSDNEAIGKVLSKSSELAGDVYELERDKEGKHGRIMKYNLSKE